jgi:hypothetical protein
MDEMKGFGENIVSLAHCQAWIFIDQHHQADSIPASVLVFQLYQRSARLAGRRSFGIPPKDWTEREERRRVFWGSFAIDRYSSVGTGWPILIDVIKDSSDAGRLVMIWLLSAYHPSLEGSRKRY